MSKEIERQTPEERRTIKKYTRGKKVTGKKTRNVKLRKDMGRHEYKIKEAIKTTADAEILLTGESGYLEAEGMERTFKFRQDQIQENLDISSAQKAFQLELNDFGPYSLDYTRNGQHMLIGGRKGHVASFDWKTGTLGMEMQLQETVHDVKWLHNELMFAVAQKHNVFIYDHTGAEIHCLRQHSHVFAMDFLPYHFLLSTVGSDGILRYQDTSTGTLVAEHRTKLGRCHVMKQNPWNAVMHLGHNNGVVSLWSPNVSTPLVRMLCHKGPVSAVALDQTGHYMTTCGLDGKMKVWDIRKYEPLNEYFNPRPATALSISQKGLLAVSYGSHVEIWKDAFRTKQKSPYMSHLQPSNTVHDIMFCPFDDVLGAGHTGGVSSLIVPGAGEANFDAFEVNPYQTKKQRQQAEVRALLDKIQPEMITLNPTLIGKVSVKSDLYHDNNRNGKDRDDDSNNIVVKNKMRGRSSVSKKVKRKQQNVIDAKREALRAEAEKREREMKAKAAELQENKPSFSYTLDRFSKKKKAVY